MEDPLKIYDDILAIANEEFNEDKINRDSDGKFAPKDGGDDAGGDDAGGDDDSSDDNKITKIGGSNNTRLDKFLNLVFLSKAATNSSPFLPILNNFIFYPLIPRWVYFTFK